MAAHRKYPEELRERAVKMALEIREREGKENSKISRVARQVDVHPEALRSWLRQAETGESAPARRRMISSELLNWSARCPDLPRANENLKAARAYFARELDPRLPR